MTIKAKSYSLLKTMQTKVIPDFNTAPEDFDSIKLFDIEFI